MASFRRPSGWTLLLLVVGICLLAGGGGLYAAVPGVEYRMTVESTDDQRAMNMTERGVDLYEFEALSPTAQSVFREGQAANGEPVMVQPDRWPDTFDYGTDTMGYTFVSDGGSYYVIRAAEMDCFAAVCDLLRGLFALVAATGAVVSAAGLWRCVDRSAAP